VRPANGFQVDDIQERQYCPFVNLFVNSLQCTAVDKNSISRLLVTHLRPVDRVLLHICLPGVTIGDPPQ
jgi:hypothetical protein